MTYRMAKKSCSYLWYTYYIKMDKTPWTYRT